MAFRLTMIIREHWTLQHKPACLPLFCHFLSTFLLQISFANNAPILLFQLRVLGSDNVSLLVRTHHLTSKEKRTKEKKKSEDHTNSLFFFFLTLQRQQEHPAKNQRQLWSPHAKRSFAFQSQSQTKSCPLK